MEQRRRVGLTFSCKKSGQNLPPFLDPNSHPIFSCKKSGQDSPRSLDPKSHPTFSCKSAQERRSNTSKKETASDEVPAIAILLVNMLTRVPEPTSSSSSFSKRKTPRKRSCATGMKDEKKKSDEMPVSIMHSFSVNTAPSETWAITMPMAPKQN